MLGYIVRRVLLMIPTLFLVSVVSFVAIQLPPGDYLTTYASQLASAGESSSNEAIEALRVRYGLGEPVEIQYAKWITGIVTRGDWGQSMEWQKPVSSLIWDRMGLTVALAVFSLLISWLIAIPAGVYTSTHQYSLPDYVLSGFSFLGVGVPAFLWALIIMYFAQSVLGLSVGGLFSEPFINAPWSWAKVIDLAQHIWIPALIVALVNTAGELRTTRANMLDEINKPYVELARAKGLTESRLIWKYPVRVALNPFFSTVGWSLASRISDITLLSVVLSLDTTGPMQLRALVSQDMYLAGSFLVLLSVLVVFGTLVSDIALAWADPRIRMEVSMAAIGQTDDKVLDIPFEEEDLKKTGEKVYVAPPLQLMWWRFRKHRMAMLSAAVLIIFYFIALFCEFVSPYDPDGALLQFKQVQPTEIHIIDDQGNWQLPFVYLHTRKMDPNTFQITNIEDKSKKFPIGLFVHGFKYSLPMIGQTDIHLFGLPDGKDVQGLFLFGTDRIGRDMFSRVSYGARLSLSMGMVSVFLSLILGILLGGISGLYGGAADTVIQRVIEFIRTIPTIPLYMTLSAALPVSWPVEYVYFGITMILALVGWTFLARVVRGRFLAMREEDFVMAARLNGSGEMRIILRHMLPSFMSYIIAALTLNIPGLILAETGLSFIGLGLRAPAISWGVLLQEATNIQSLMLAPWVLAPGVAVVISVLAFNFLGDGLRDAADPYAR